MATHGEIRWPPPGTFSGRLRGDFHGRRHADAPPARAPRLRTRASVGKPGRRRRGRDGSRTIQLMKRRSRRSVDRTRPRSPAASAWTTIRAWGKPAAALVTFGIAVLGAITGTIAYREERRVDIRVAATERVAVAFVEQALPVAITNQSRRAVTLVDGVVLLNGREVGTATGLVLHSSGTVSGQGAQALELPFGLDAQSTVAAAVTWRLNKPKYWNDAWRPWRMVPSEDPPNTSAPVLAVRLTFDPGGRRTAQIQTQSFGKTELSGVIIRTGWSIELRRRQDGTVRSMWVRTVDRAQPAILTLSLWGPGSPKITATITRPTDLFRTIVPLPNLPKGRYRWSLTEGSQVVATGTMLTPCPAPLNAPRSQVCDSASQPRRSGP